MVIGYFEGVNNIIIYTTEGKRLKRTLGVKGINKLSDNTYTYYDTSLLLHILDMRYIKYIKLYNDKKLISVI
jgi:hypothetical protein